MAFGGDYVISGNVLISRRICYAAGMGKSPGRSLRASTNDASGPVAMLSSVVHCTR